MTQPVIAANWLLSKPWRWHYRTLYRTFRNEQRHPPLSGKCASPRLAERGMCKCMDPRSCPYSKAGRKRVIALLRAQGLLDKDGKVRQ
jgi:hypothetical protein